MFIELPTFVILTSVMSAIQISIWKTLPENVRDLIMSNKAGAFIINLAGSNLIVSFTGVASVVGVCNLAASVVFGGYSAYYTKKKGHRRSRL